MRPASILGIFALLKAVTGFPGPSSSPRQNLQQRNNLITNQTLTPTTLFEFPNPTWLENFAFTTSGSLVITLIGPATAYLYNPITQTPPVQLFTIPGYTALLGIVETSPDTFYIVAGNVTGGTSAAGSYSLFKFSLSTSNSDIVPTKVLDIPEGSFLNGLEVLSHSTDSLILLVSDSTLGVVWKVDVTALTYEIFIDIPEMKVAVDAPIPLGVNGIHIQDSYLYFTSMTQELFCRIPLHRTSAGWAVGTVEVLASGIFGDDFTLDRYGNGWIAENPHDKVTLVVGGGKNKGEVVVVAGAQDAAAVAGGTRCAFGRTERDKDILYVVTNGGSPAPPVGGVVGGKILALDTKGYLAAVLG